MNPVLRWSVLLSALALTLGAVLMDWPGEQAWVPPGARAAPANLARQPAAAFATRSADRTDHPPAVRMRPVGPNLFAVRELQLRPVARKEPPPPPLAPPLPFRYQGKVIEDGRVIAFLAEGTRTHVVRAGDRLTSYQVEDITAAGMTLVYLPLNEKQQLMFGSPN